MWITILKLVPFLSLYIVFFFILIRRRRAYIPSTGTGNHNGGNNNNNDDNGGGGGENEPDDFPTLDLPPGVYLLPPDAPDPSLKQTTEKVEL